MKTFYYSKFQYRFLLLIAVAILLIPLRELARDSIDCKAVGFAIFLFVLSLITSLIIRFKTKDRGLAIEEDSLCTIKKGTIDRRIEWDSISSYRLPRHLFGWMVLYDKETNVILRIPRNIKGFDEIQTAIAYNLSK